jgi:hypothetical protein
MRGKEATAVAIDAVSQEQAMHSTGPCTAWHTHGVPSALRSGISPLGTGRGWRGEPVPRDTWVSRQQRWWERGRVRRGRTSGGSQSFLNGRAR